MGGRVDYECFYGCAAPGKAHYRVAGKRFEDLVTEFRKEGFFDIGRTDPNRYASDVPAIRLTYRDELRIHEVVDINRRDARITRLEERFRELTEFGRYNRPSPSLYRTLLNQGWNINQLGANQENALSSAVLHRDLESIRFLLQHGSRVTPRSIGYAALSENLDLLRMIVESADTKLMAESGAEALVQAARSRNPNLLRFLLDSGVDPNLQTTGSGLTALMSAVDSGQLENANLLLEKGARVNVRDDAGRSALSYAATALDTGFITLLVRQKANVDGTDNQGRTALIQAAEYCYTWDIEALLRAGADTAIRDQQGKTARDATARRADPKCKAAQEMLPEAARPLHSHPSRTAHRE